MKDVLKLLMVLATLGLYIACVAYAPLRLVIAYIAMTVLTMMWCTKVSLIRA